MRNFIALLTLALISYIAVAEDIDITASFKANPEKAFGLFDNSREWHERTYLFISSDLELKDDLAIYMGERLYYILIGPDNEDSSKNIVKELARINPPDLSTEAELKINDYINNDLSSSVYEAGDAFIVKVHVKADILSVKKYNKALRKLFKKSPGSALMAQPLSVRTENTGFPEYEISQEAKDAGFKSVFLPLAALIKPDGTVAKVDYKGQGQGKWEEPEKTVVEGFFRAVERELTFEPSPDNRWWVLSMCITLKAEE